MGLGGMLGVLQVPALCSPPPRSPGRSPSSHDNEIVMMNHVYKERFPKVGGWGGAEGGYGAMRGAGGAPKRAPNRVNRTQWGPNGG